MCGDSPSSRDRIFKSQFERLSERINSVHTFFSVMWLISVRFLLKCMRLRSFIDIVIKLKRSLKISIIKSTQLHSTIQCGRVPAYFSVALTFFFCWLFSVKWLIVWFIKHCNATFVGTKMMSSDVLFCPMKHIHLLWCKTRKSRKYSHWESKGTQYLSIFA